MRNREFKNVGGGRLLQVDRTRVLAIYVGKRY